MLNIRFLKMLLPQKIKIKKKIKKKIRVKIKLTLCIPTYYYLKHQIITM
jgi:hypothetical protein